MLARYLWRGPAVEKVHYFGFVLPNPVPSIRIPQADWVGVATPTTGPLVLLIDDHMLRPSARKDTIVPVMAKGKTRWATDLSARRSRRRAASRGFFYSPDRRASICNSIARALPA